MQYTTSATPAQDLTETTSIHHPPAWDTTSGPTVTRHVSGFGYVGVQQPVAGLIPVPQAQSAGADVSGLVADVRQLYQEIRVDAVAGFPVMTAGNHRPAAPDGALLELAFGWLLLVVVALGLFGLGMALGHWATASGRLDRRLGRRRRRRDRAA